jgi:hypothetical protein
MYEADLIHSRFTHRCRPILFSLGQGDIRWWPALLKLAGGHVTFSGKSHRIMGSNFLEHGQCIGGGATTPVRITFMAFKNHQGTLRLGLHLKQEMGRIESWAYT